MKPKPSSKKPTFAEKSAQANALVKQSEELLQCLSDKLANAETQEAHESLSTLLQQHIELKDKLAETQAEYAQALAKNAQVQSEYVRLRAELNAAERERAEYEKRSAQLERERDKLAQQVEYLKRLMWGRRSEKLNNEELHQLALAFGVDAEAAKGSDPSLPIPEPVVEQNVTEPETTTPRKKHPGRTRLSPALERVVHEPAAVQESERACKCCGAEMSVLGYLEHERVEYVPAKLVVHVERREKRVCKACRQDAVTAERSTPSVSRRAGASLLAHLVESKCDDALPIYRQRDQLARLGFEVPPNTLYGYWAYVTDLLRPVADTTLSVVLGDPVYVALDDTSLKVLDNTKKAGTYRGHLWCFTGTSPLVGYAFTETWSATDVAPWIRAIDAFIQCDDYKGYSAKIQTESGEDFGPLVDPERRLGCMMHVRRKFHEALSLGDKRAAEPLKLIADLYAVEALAKEQGLSAEQRLVLRSERSLSLLAAFEAQANALAAACTPASTLGNAARYAIGQRPYLRRCFTDGRFEIDNGRVERLIREPALGRKNFLFTGSADGAKRLAAAYSLVQSCRNLGISTRDYLIDIIDKLDAGWPVRRVAELVPDRWARDRGLLTQLQQTAQ